MLTLGISLKTPKFFRNEVKLNLSMLAEEIDAYKRK